MSGVCPQCGKPNRCSAESGACWCFTAVGSASAEGETCLCEVCLKVKEAESIFDENGALTREFLLARGTCCGNKCRNCPYDWSAVSS